METISFVAIVILLFSLTNSLKIARDHERFAIFSFGKFVRLKGPGLFFKLPINNSEWFRISIGDNAQLVAPKIAMLKSKQIPVEIDYKTPLDAIIRITGFTETAVHAMRLTNNQTRKVRCDKCGHEISVT